MSLRLFGSFHMKNAQCIIPTHQKLNKHLNTVNKIVITIFCLPSEDDCLVSETRDEVLFQCF